MGDTVAHASKKPEDQDHQEDTARTGPPGDGREQTPTGGGGGGGDDSPPPKPVTGENGSPPKEGTGGQAVSEQTDDPPPLDNDADRTDVPDNRQGGEPKLNGQEPDADAVSTATASESDDGEVTMSVENDDEEDDDASAENGASVETDDAMSGEHGASLALENDDATSSGRSDASSDNNLALPLSENDASSTTPRDDDASPGSGALSSAGSGDGAENPAASTSERGAESDAATVSAQDDPARDDQQGSGVTAAETAVAVAPAGDNSCPDTGVLASGVSAEETKESGKKKEPAATRSTPGGPPAKSTMEQELDFLKDEVRQKTACVHRLQTSLYDQQVRANVAMVTLRTQLRKKDAEMRQQRGHHEQKMEALLQHLLYLEGQMRQEQRQVLAALHEKDDVIRRQKSAIEDLSGKNAKLLTALKEVHGYSGGNGISSSPSSTAGVQQQQENLSNGNASASAAAGIIGGVGGGMAMMGSSPQVVLRNKDKGQKVRFSSVKDKLRRHKSSLELHRPASLETLLEGTLRYGSQENLAAAGGSGGSGAHQPPATTSSPIRSSVEGMCSDELKRSRQHDRKERCRSLVDYPFRLNDLPEVSTEAERGRSSESLQLMDPLQSSSSSSSTSSSSAQHHHQQMQHPDHSPRPNSLYSDEDDAFGAVGSGGQGKQYGELAKATSMPQSLSSVSQLGGDSAVQANVRERPHSLSVVELSLKNMDRMSMNPAAPAAAEMVSMNPSPTSHLPPGGVVGLCVAGGVAGGGGGGSGGVVSGSGVVGGGGGGGVGVGGVGGGHGSESNPFKSFKNVFRRKNSKQRGKKQRPASLQANDGRHPHHEIKEHFKKYDLP